MKTKPTRPTTTQAKASFQFEDIRAFHAKGRASLSEYPGRVDYGKMKGTTPAEKSKLELLRRARRFAATYKGTRFESLLRRAEKAGCALQVGYAYRLAGLESADRKAIEAFILTHQPSLGELDAVVRKQVGRRRQGGRRFKVDSVEMLRFHLSTLASGFVRLVDAVGPDGGDKPGSPFWSELTGKERKHVAHVRQAAGRLLKELNAPAQPL